MLMRMQVRFDTNDNEPLALDLSRYKKGQRRVARLLTLATYGLFYLHGRTESESPSSSAPSSANDATAGRHYEYKMTPDDLVDVFGSST